MASKPIRRDGFGHPVNGVSKHSIRERFIEATTDCFSVAEIYAAPMVVISRRRRLNIRGIALFLHPVARRREVPMQAIRCFAMQSGRAGPQIRGAPAMMEYFLAMQPEMA